tara:strand:+ start:1911 stop:2072 length:162 start_codon:yes stop_codon:yes gene_type:complete
MKELHEDFGMDSEELIKELQNCLWANGGGKIVITHKDFAISLEEDDGEATKEE